VHLRPLLLEQGLTMDGVSETLGALTPGCSGADIFNICNEAAITASRLKKSAVDMECFNAALDRTLVGLKRGARKLKTFEKERLAIHEAGKVVLSWFQPSTDPIMKATIAPHGGMMRGKTLRLPQEKYIITQQQLHERMVQRLGGYVAEKFFFSDVSANAADDLEQVTDSAHQEITVYGMLPDVVGHFGFPGERNAYEALPYGPEKANVIDKSVTTLMQQTQRAAEALLQKYVTEVRIVAGTLLAQETVTARELYLLLGERPVMSDEFRKYLETAHSAGPKPEVEDEAATPAVALPGATGVPAPVAPAASA
jgi:AFG3 family protein